MEDIIRQENWWERKDATITGLSADISPFRFDKFGPNPNDNLKCINIWN